MQYDCFKHDESIFDICGLLRQLHARGVQSSSLEEESEEELDSEDVEELVSLLPLLLDESDDSCGRKSDESSMLKCKRALSWANTYRPTVKAMAADLQRVASPVAL